MSVPLGDATGYISKYKLIVLAGLLELVYVLGYGVIWFILPLIAEDITKDIVAVGLLIAFPTVVSILFAIPVGAFSDRFGRKLPVLFGSLMIVTIGLFLPSVHSFTSFALFGLFFGLGHQLFNTPIKAYIMDISPKGKTAEYFAVYSTSFSIGLTLGSVVGGFLLANNLAVGVGSISHFYLVTGLVAFFVTLCLKETVTSSDKSIKITAFLRKDHHLIRQLLQYKKIGIIGLLILYLNFIMYFAAGMTWTLEPLYYQLNINSQLVGVILGMFVLPLILFTIPAGYLADKYGKTKFIVPGLLVAGIFLSFFGLTTDPLFLFLSAFISTTGLAFVWASNNGLLVDVSSKYDKGGIAGIWNISEDLGYIIGPTFGGLMAGLFGSIRIPFLIVGILIVVSALPVTIAIRKSHKS